MFFVTQKVRELGKSEPVMEVAEVYVCPYEIFCEWVGDNGKIHSAIFQAENLVWAD